MPNDENSEKSKAYAGVLDAILSGAFASDVPLSERKLSESLGIGRTPVREAIKDLVREGVLDRNSQILPASGDPKQCVGGGGKNDTALLVMVMMMMMMMMMIT